MRNKKNIKVTTESVLKSILMKLFIPCFITLSILNLTGFTMNDQLTKKMDSAYASRENNEDVSRIVQKYFPHGMEISRALTKLHDSGFMIREYHYEWGRLWPDGEIKYYMDNSVKRNIQSKMTKEQIDYVAEKKYDSLIFIGKRAIVSFEVNKGRISNSKGSIYVDGI